MPDVYAVCKNNCKYPTYTREQVLSLLQQAITDGSLLDIDAEYAAIRKLIDSNGGDDIIFWTGTEAEFNALDPAPVVRHFIPRRGADGKIYICIDDSSVDGIPTEPLTAETIRSICAVGG